MQYKKSTQRTTTRNNAVARNKLKGKPSPISSRIIKYLGVYSTTEAKTWALETAKQYWKSGRQRRSTKRHLVFMVLPCMQEEFTEDAGQRMGWDLTELSIVPYSPCLLNWNLTMLKTKKQKTRRERTDWSVSPWTSESTTEWDKAKGAQNKPDQRASSLWWPLDTSMLYLVDKHNG